LKRNFATAVSSSEAAVDEFFVGYLPVPHGIRRFVTRVIASLIGLTACTALVLVLAQSPFAPAIFRIPTVQQPRGHAHRTSLPRTLQADGSWWHPASTAPVGLPTGYIRLQGQRIRNGEDRMLEIRPGSIQAVAGAGPAENERDFGDVEFRGEIVDSKCYFGVMNPGRGKVHRDCAARCIAGGIPPALLVRDASGQARTILLATADRRPMGLEVLPRIAEPVAAKGRLLRTNGHLLLLLSGLDRLR
jgi:hypothetical protein